MPVGLKYKNAVPMPSGTAVYAGIPFSRPLGEHQTPGRQHEEIQCIDIDVNITQKPVDVVRLDALRKQTLVDLRIDVLRHSGHGVDFGLPHEGHEGAGLPVQVMHVEVGDIEMAGAEPGKRQQVGPTYATQAGDGNARLAQLRIYP
jgi:hypothetical protein